MIETSELTKRRIEEFIINADIGDTIRLNPKGSPEQKMKYTKSSRTRVYRFENKTGIHLESRRRGTLLYVTYKGVRDSVKLQLESDFFERRHNMFRKVLADIRSEAEDSDGSA